MATIDYAQLINNAARAVQGVAPQTPVTVPKLTTGQPIIPQGNLMDIISQALIPADQRQPTPADKTDAMIRIGTSLLQPRKQGQSVAGQVGSAVQGGLDSMDAALAARDRNLMQKAQLASTVVTQDTQRRQAEMNMQYMADKWPTEFAALQQQLRTASLNGDIATQNAIKARLEVDPQIFKQKMDEEAALNAAKIKHLNAQSAAEHARQAAYQAALKPDQVTVLSHDDTTGAYTAMVRGAGGKNFILKHVPGLTQQEAQAQVDQTLGGVHWWKSHPTQQEYNDAVAKLMQPKTTYEEVGQAGTPPATPQPPATLARPQPQASGPQPIKYVMKNGKAVPEHSQENVQTTPEKTAPATPPQTDAQRRADFESRQKAALDRIQKIDNDPQLNALLAKEKEALRNGKAVEANAWLAKYNKLKDKLYPKPK